MESFVLKEVEFVNFLLTAPLHQCMVILKSLSKSQVNALSEVAHNVLYNSEEVDEELIKELSSYASLLRKVGDRSSSLLTRRRIIARNAKKVIKVLHMVEQILPTHGE